MASTKYSVSSTLLLPRVHFLDSEHERNHPPRPAAILSVLRILGRDQSFFAKDSDQGAAHYQNQSQERPCRPVRHGSGARKQTKRCIDRMPNMAIRASRNQTAFSRVSPKMVTTPAKGYPRPKKQNHRPSLDQKDRGRSREKPAQQQKHQQSPEHPEIAAQRQNTKHQAPFSTCGQQMR